MMDYVVLSGWQDSETKIQIDRVNGSSFFFEIVICGVKPYSRMLLVVAASLPIHLLLAVRLTAHKTPRC
jgi:hypothetical protein